MWHRSKEEKLKMFYADAMLAPPGSSSDSRLEPGLSILPANTSAFESATKIV